MSPLTVAVALAAGVLALKILADLTAGHLARETARLRGERERALLAESEAAAAAGGGPGPGANPPGVPAV